jgi:hypothetical protein
MRRIIPLALSLMLLAMVLPGAVSAAKPGSGAGVSTPVTGTLADGGAFTGALALTKVAAQNGQLVGTGTLTGTLTDALGNVLGTVTQAVNLPLQASGTCAILHLTLGPLDLNLLGLMVHLNQIVLNIDASAVPGNLLGNLLCAVAHLLDSSGNPLGGLSALLNHILGILGGLTL